MLPSSTASTKAMLVQPAASMSSASQPGWRANSGSDLQRVRQAHDQRRGVHRQREPDAAEAAAFEQAHGIPDHAPQAGAGHHGQGRVKTPRVDGGHQGVLNTLSPTPFPFGEVRWGSRECPVGERRKPRTPGQEGRAGLRAKQGSRSAKFAPPSGRVSSAPRREQESPRSGGGRGGNSYVDSFLR
jgi:hypothetical protein